MRRFDLAANLIHCRSLTSQLGLPLRHRAPAALDHPGKAAMNIDRCFLGACSVPSSADVSVNALIVEHDAAGHSDFSSIAAPGIDVITSACPN